jgi:hypothetical protein
MSGALNSVFGGGIGQIAMSVAGTIFPPLGIAQAAGGLLQGALGSAVKQGLDILTQPQFGMPKFIAEGIKDVVSNVLDKLTKGGDKGCEEHVRDRCGNGFEDFASKFRDNFVRNVIENMRNDECGGGRKKPKSWFEAVTQALGQELDKQAKEIEKLSSEITDSNAKDKPSTMLELQTASQRLNMMISAANEFAKTVGQGLDKLVQSR